MPPPNGFEYQQRGDGTIVITTTASTPRRCAANAPPEFVDDVDANPREVMARWTGNYRRGSERMSRDHPRNRNR